jgi:hypothetical protein
MGLEELRIATFLPADEATWTVVNRLADGASEQLALHSGPFSMTSEVMDNGFPLLGYCACSNGC